MKPSNYIFVFGSNLAGRHGKGAAREALVRFGAIYGQGEGLQGMSYAIPTKTGGLGILSLERIAGYINTFCLFVRQNPQYSFYITPIGTGLAGYRVDQIRPLFHDIEDNPRVIWASTWNTKAGR